MSYISGYELAALLHKEVPNMPVIMVTGAIPSDRNDRWKMPVWYPFSPNQLTCWRYAVFSCELGLEIRSGKT
jgi:hypothetical protein